jgi:hypothetical protein
VLNQHLMSMHCAIAEESDSLGDSPFRSPFFNDLFSCVLLEGLIYHPADWILGIQIH